jgi:peptidoglycan/LPS O-acetylase OafA/YrhL
MSNFKPSYRPDIDGLRAFAVIPVILFHAFPHLLPGGFVGVDIFFVISGFLISTIVVHSLANDKFSFLEFYEHRARRIFPGFVLVVASSLLLASAVLMPSQFDQLGRHALASTLFLQNFNLAGEAGYFDAASETKPLLHMWSLSIEEQFYVLFPLVAWFLRGRLQWLFGVVVACLVMSLVMNLATLYEWPTAVFYYPQYRVWELLAGVLLAVGVFQFGAAEQAIARHWCGRGLKWQNALACLGAVLLVLALLSFDSRSPYPGWRALLPVTGALLVIAAGPSAWLNRRVLSARLPVLIGKISYPLYLWHWPLLSLCFVYFKGEVPVQWRMAMIVITGVLAWLTFQFIELPIRRSARPQLFSAAAIASLMLVAAVGFFVDRIDGVTRYTEHVAKLGKAAGQWEYPGKLTRKSSEQVTYLFQSSGAAESTMFLGDSNIEQFYPRFDELQLRDGARTANVAYVTGGGCLPVRDVDYGIKHQHCNGLVEGALRVLKADPSIRRVAVAASWNGYLLSGYGLTGEWGVESPNYQEALQDLTSFLRAVRGMGREAYVLLTIPQHSKLDPLTMVQRDVLNYPRVFSIDGDGVELAELLKRSGQVERDIAAAVQAAGANLIDPKNYLCDPRCAGLTPEGEPKYKDAYHLHPAYVRHHLRFLDGLVSASGMP